MARKNNAATAGLEELLTQLNEEAAADEAAPDLDDGIVKLPAGGQKLCIFRPSRLAENFVRRSAYAVPCWLVYAVAKDGKVSAFHAYSFHGPSVEPFVNLSGSMPEWMPRRVPGVSTSARDGELAGFQWGMSTVGDLTIYTKQRDVSLVLQPSAAKVGTEKPLFTFEPPKYHTEGLTDALLLIHKVAATSMLLRSGHATRAIELVVNLSSALVGVEAGGAQSVSPQCAVYALPSPETLRHHTPGLTNALRVILEMVRSRRNLLASQMCAHTLGELLRVVGFLDEARREEAERRIAVEHQEAERRRVQELLGVGDEA